MWCVHLTFTGKQCDLSCGYSSVLMSVNVISINFSVSVSFQFFFLIFQFPFQLHLQFQHNGLVVAY